MSKSVVIVLASICIFVILKVEIQKAKKIVAKKKERKKEEIASRGKTEVFNEWTLCELNSKGEVISEIPIDESKSSQKEGFTIGRNLSCDYSIKTQSAYVSGIHAKVFKDNRGFYIVDNNSVNHMFINLEQVKCCPLTTESVVFLANVPIYFRHNVFNMDMPVPEKVKHEVNKKDLLTRIVNVREEETKRMI